MVVAASNITREKGVRVTHGDAGEYYGIEITGLLPCETSPVLGRFYLSRKRLCSSFQLEVKIY
jgi:hypothetical protein